MRPEVFRKFSVVVPRFVPTGGKAVITDHSMGDHALKLFA